MLMRLSVWMPSAVVADMTGDAAVFPVIFLIVALPDGERNVAAIAELDENRLLRRGGGRKDKRQRCRQRQGGPVHLFIWHC